MGMKAVLEEGIWVRIKVQQLVWRETSFRGRGEWQQGNGGQ